MSDEAPAPTVPPIPCYKPWVGVVLSFLVTGLGPFMAGRKRLGVAWFMALLMFAVFWRWALGASLVPAVFALWILGGIGFVLWVIMLWKSCTAVPRFKKRLWFLFGGLFVVIGLGQGEISALFTQPFKVPTGAMSPTLQGSRSGTNDHAKATDHLFVSRSAYWFSKPNRGDVIVFKTDGIESMHSSQQGQIYVKRVVGLPGDRISIQDGRVMNNGVSVSDPVVFTKLKYEIVAKGGPQYLRQEGEVFDVPADSYFVLGDNSANSYDSRFWGVLPAKNVFGRATKIYWPPDRVGAIE